ncbi:hypothetical protein B0J13DRAFT_678687 [Dactylonectria estremocensis]|uniref:Nudix hydrolase domain-containing protein n=1 Tax=Dactylonectria estremocensis TaxID=1079267 RepID=A0A9P9E6N6_9HYPO|nr:hypothetical protein B0J13DRAFT_678687 [Dactylonectria estremocensis]
MSSGITDEAAIEGHDLIHNAEVEEQKLHGSHALTNEDLEPASESDLGKAPPSGAKKESAMDKTITMTSAWVHANNLKKRLELTREELGINLVYGIGVAIYRGDPDKDRGEDVEIYIAKRKTPGAEWTLPASDMKPNEKMREAINRVALKEMGHEVDQIKVEIREIGFTSQTGNMGTLFHFAATIKDESQPRIRMEIDHSEWRWVRADQIYDGSLTSRMQSNLIACFARIKGTVAR